jgi:hypothetical protein
MARALKHQNTIIVQSKTGVIYDRSHSTNVTHIPHWLTKLVVQLEEIIQAAEITKLTLEHVTVATPCNKVTVNSNSTAT